LNFKSKLAVVIRPKLREFSVRDHFEISNPHETKAQMCATSGDWHGSMEPFVDAARAAEPITDHSLYLKVSAIAKRWDCSEDKVNRIVEKYRGRSGFLDLAIVSKKRKRKYAIIRIAPFLLKEIEGNLR
jgi:hypothetical protein